MEFVFRISRYDDPSLEEETTRLLARRLEIRSREAIPGSTISTPMPPRVPAGRRAG